MAIAVEDRTKRWDAWRTRQPLPRPLLGLAWEPEVPPLPEILDQIGVGHEVSPDQIRPEMVLPYVEQWYRQDCALHSDVIQSFGPAFGLPWVEAIAGCPVAAYPGSLWAESCLDRLAGRQPIRFDRDNPWLRKLVEFTQALVGFSAGRFPVCLPLMRGPLDTLAALRTPAGMCLDLVDHPDEVHRILSELAELWIGIAETLLPLIPPWHGGYGSRMRMWAPGPAITPQNDVSSLLSPAMYERFALPADRRIVDCFPYSSFHMHSTEHHQMRGLCRLENLTALQLFLQQDSGGPPLDRVMPSVRETLQTKPLLLGAMDIECAEYCLQELPAQGLCLMIAGSWQEIPAELAEWLEQHCVE